LSAVPFSGVKSNADASKWLFITKTVSWRIDTMAVSCPVCGSTRCLLLHRLYCHGANERIFCPVVKK
jgi:hypothetical protein